MSTTPVHSHPLSPADLPPRSSRNSRASREPDPRPSANYYTLKAQQERNSDWDGSVRGHRRPERRKSADVFLDSPSPSSVASPRVAPLIVVASSTNPPATPSRKRTADADVDTLTTQVLATRWHEYSDEAIQTAVSKLSASDSPAVSSNPYHLALRSLSLALSNLSRARAELEEQRRKLQEREEERRRRADDLLHELPVAERDTARRVIQAIFTDEEQHKVLRNRKQSFMVKCTFLLLVAAMLLTPRIVAHRILVRGYCGRGSAFSQCPRGSQDANSVNSRPVRYSCR